MRTGGFANDYEVTLREVEGCDAVMHPAAVLDLNNRADAKVHHSKINSAFHSVCVAAESRLENFSYTSTVNATDMAYAEQSSRPVPSG